MLPVIHHRIGKALAVVLALVAWFGTAYLLHLRDHLQDAWQRIGWYGSGGAIFFLLAVFLPECRKLSFLSRQSALRLMAFMLFLIATELIIHFKSSFERPWLVAAVYACPFIAYFAAVYLIRGLRTPPQYPVEVEARGGDAGDPGAAPTPALAPEKPLVRVEPVVTPASQAAEAVNPASEDSRVGSLLGRLNESSGVGKG